MHFCAILFLLVDNKSQIMWKNMAAILSVSDAKKIMESGSVEERADALSKVIKELI